MRIVTVGTYTVYFSVKLKRIFKKKEKKTRSCQHHLRSNLTENSKFFHTKNFGDFMKYLQSERELIYRFNDLFGQTVLFNVLLTNVIITTNQLIN